MQVYAGTKLIKAAPMTRGDYNIFRGWQLPADECGDDKGYLVEYLDGGKSNTDQFIGYVSWIPKDVFERTYVQNEAMPFGLALELCKQGYRIARIGWNGKGQYLQLIDPAAAHINECPVDPQNPEQFKQMVLERPGRFNALFSVNDNNLYAPGTMRPWIGIKTADNQFMPWVASQSDMLCNDWVIHRCPPEL
ncbi:TPA: DUF2829 domain-containing protein [Citrobacter freundii]|nr:DUF2829 domain-containing protein [Citrobacter freundii]HAT3963804.1 DUF2829 domain-containing protein [Citrobacter freundii]